VYSFNLTVTHKCIQYCIVYLYICMYLHVYNVTTTTLNLNYLSYRILGIVLI